MSTGPEPAPVGHDTEPGTVVPGWQHAIALTGGVALWLLHLAGAMALVGISCQWGSAWPIHALTVATAIPTIACGWLGASIARRGGTSERDQANAFLGWVAVALDAISLLLIVFETSTAFFLDVCPA